jgi:hypothetical protein
LITKLIKRKRRANPALKSKGGVKEEENPIIHMVPPDIYPFFE